jgi:predicted nuclease of predicted toxin-antitoxin system
VKLWLDQMLPRRLCDDKAEWTNSEVRHVGTGCSEDEEIFLAARAAGAAVLTSDRDSVSLIERLGPPPQVIWLRCGNCSNRELGRPSP